MADAISRRLLGSPDQGIHSAHCLCGHERCDSLKADKWCCHWFFLYLVPSGTMILTEVLRVLRDRMGTTESDCHVNPTSMGAFRILVHVKDFTVLGNGELNFLPEVCDWDFVRDQCRAWRLTCCREALIVDSICWRSLLKETGGRATFWKSREVDGDGDGAGGRTLVDELTDQVRKTIGT